MDNIYYLDTIMRVIEDLTKKLINRIEVLEEWKEGVVPLRRVSIEEFQKDYPDVLHHKPHKCPVCDGKGNHQILQGNHQTLHSEPPYILNHDCKGCNGKGIVWG